MCFGICNYFFLLPFLTVTYVEFSNLQSIHRNELLKKQESYTIIASAIDTYELHG